MIKKPESKLKVNIPQEKKTIKPLEPVEEVIYTCCTCGSKYKDQAKNFPYSQSIFFKGNNNRLPICNNCLNSMTDQYTELLGSNDEAIKRMCLHWDIYLSETTLDSSKKIDANRSRIKEYIRQCNLNQNAGKSYDTYLEERSRNHVNLIEDIEDLKADSAPIKVNPNSIKIWGFGFSLEDYEYLNNQYSDWKAKCIIDGKARESLVRELCIIKLQQNKALFDQKVDLYDKLTQTYQKVLNNANLTPKQEDTNDKLTEIPLGMMIDRFENERPVPEPNEEWKDVDGIMKLILVYFIGHLCKMLGIKNKYSQLYEEEMDTYRVKIPELETAETEEVFDYLLDNGFSDSDKPKDESDNE